MVIVTSRIFSPVNHWCLISVILYARDLCAIEMRHLHLWQYKPHRSVTICCIPSTFCQLYPTVSSAKLQYVRPGQGTTDFPQQDTCVSVRKCLVQLAVNMVTPSKHGCTICWSGREWKFQTLPREKQSKVAVEKKGTAESYEVERFWTIMGNCTVLLMLL